MKWIMPLISSHWSEKYKIRYYHPVDGRKKMDFFSHVFVLLAFCIHLVTVFVY